MVTQPNLNTVWINKLVVADKCSEIAEKKHSIRDEKEKGKTAIQLLPF